MPACKGESKWEIGKSRNFEGFPISAFPFPMQDACFSILLAATPNDDNLNPNSFATEYIHAQSHITRSP